MEDKEMKQRLTINPDTFLWLEDKYGLLYDSGSFASYKFRLTPQISQLCDRLQDPDNLYSVEVDLDNTDDEFSDFIAQVTRKGMGRTHDDSGERHLISFPPLLNVQHSWERIKTRGNEAYSEILPYLTSLTFNLGGTCPVTDYYKQTTYPVCSETILSAERILGFLLDAGSPYITDIGIVFSSLKDYQDINPLLAGLQEYGDAVTLYVRAEDLEEAETAAILSNVGIRMAVLHTASFATDINPMSQARHIFLITSEKEYTEVNKWSSDNGIDPPEIVPIFNGKNAAFFRRNVFLSEHEILDSRLIRRSIFAHMVINTGYFGKLTFMPDGKAYADPASGISVGCINDSVYTLITAELEHNTGWRRTRDTLERCNKCIYRYLCPSPSPYEKVMRLDCICTDFKEEEVT